MKEYPKPIILQTTLIYRTRTYSIMEEIKNLIRVWILAFAALSFCYFVIKQIPKGVLRHISLIPIICLFLYLPLTLSSIHFIATAFFFITWLGSFKLLLFASNQGPIGDPSLPFQHFIPISCLPISTNPSKKPLETKIPFIIKTLFLGLAIKSYDYKQFMHPILISAFYCSYLYLVLEIILATSAYPAQAIFGFEIEPQFQDPFLSTSLQDFWGRRWNLMVPAILRPSVYQPIRTLCIPPLGRKLAFVVAMLSSFTVAGLMHELLIYYMTRVNPTWEVTAFFVLHGACTGIEVLVKKAVGGRWRLHPVISGGLTILFLAVTSSWLFFTPIVRNQVDVKTFKEYAVLGNSVKNLVAVNLSFRSF